MDHDTVIGFITNCFLSNLTGGCELSVMEKRNIIMINNSDKVYKFEWQEVDHICVKPSVGYILPGEEKDMEIMFISTQLVSIKRVFTEIFFNV